MRGKIKTTEEALRMREDARRKKKAVVFTNGCFDLLHPGHVDYLEEARAQGDLLIVGLNSDASVRRIKGEGRPVMGLDDRAAVLAGLAAVDAVVIFDEDDPRNLIKALMPDVLVKGEDWSEAEIIGADLVQAAGGLVVRAPLTKGKSTSDIIKKIRNSG